MESKALKALELYELSRDEKLTEREKQIFYEAFAMGMNQTVAEAIKIAKEG